MINTKYYKDYGRNYLIITNANNSQCNSYQLRMITRNQIKGLLPCQERHINGDILLYYEISSRQSMQHVFDEKKMDMKELRNFFMQLKVVNDLLQKYLLSGNDLLLQPEYIFISIETAEYGFVFYSDDSNNANFQILIDFLIAAVDNEDAEAVETVYRIADLVQRDKFQMEEILSWFPEEPRFLEKLENRKDNREAQNDSVSFQSMQLSEVSLTEEKQPFCLKLWIKRFFSRNRKEKKKNLSEVKRYIQTEEQEEKTEEKTVGNTVFIPWTEGCENKLYGMNKGNKYHIDLGKLPLTVGKLAGAVDLVIGEHSISRMHAKFYREGNNIYIKDLNSTNGTFRNGMRLNPNTSEIIEPGDEIKLGKLNFIYR